MDLTQKLWERPTPKFSEAVASCGRASRRILIAGTEHGQLSSSRWEEALELPLAFQKKNGRCLGGPKTKSIIISVYQRTCCGANLFSITRPKKAVIPPD
jgi:hypothetical protein